MGRRHLPRRVCKWFLSLVPADGIAIVKIVLLLSGLAVALHTVAGRMSARMLFAPLAFLMTRPWVLVGWVVGTAGMFGLLVDGAAKKGTSPSVPFMLGLSVFCGFGFAALVVGLGFMIVRVFARRPQLELTDGEEIIARNAANHMLGRESRGGELVLTTLGLRFVPHRFNVQLDTWFLAYRDLTRIEVPGTRLIVLETAGSEHLLVAPDPAGLAETLLASAGRAGADISPP